MSSFTVEFHTAEPIAYHIVDLFSGLDTVARLSCAGSFTYEAPTELPQEELLGEFMPELAKTLSKMSEMGLGYASIPHFNGDTHAFMREALEERWAARGIELTEVIITETSLDPEDEAAIEAFLIKRNDPAAAVSAAVNPAMFVSNAQTASVASEQVWICGACGTVNDGKFCKECGTKRA